MRSTIVSLACNNDIQGCKTESVNLFDEWMSNPDNNPYVVCLHYFNFFIFMFFFSEYSDTKTIGYVLF